MSQSSISIRQLQPDDFLPLIAVMDDWWGGRQVSHLLSRFFFEHFHDTSFVAERGSERIGFLIGFLSQTQPDEAYIRFSAVHPHCRGQGVGRLLYESFFSAMHRHGRGVVRCITSPQNTGSIAFHTRLGFAMEEQETVVGGIPIHCNYDGRGGDRVLFVKTLDK